MIDFDEQGNDKHGNGQQNCFNTDKRLWILQLQT